MSNLGRRVEKLERKTQSIKYDDGDREAYLLEIQRLEGQDSLRVALLRLELEYGHPFTLTDLAAMGAVKQTKDF